MITKAEAKRLHASITQVVKAACAAEHAGGADPLEAAYLRRRAATARKSLGSLIASLTQDEHDDGAA